MLYSKASSSGITTLTSLIILFIVAEITELESCWFTISNTLVRCFNSAISNDTVDVYTHIITTSITTLLGRCSNNRI